MTSHSFKSACFCLLVGLGAACSFDASRLRGSASVVGDSGDTTTAPDTYLGAGGSEAPPGDDGNINTDGTLFSPDLPVANDDGNPAVDSTTQTGGTVATGGIIGTGGTVATAGITGMGGTVATGGILGMGGTVVTGGILGMGGTLATSGTIDAGGTIDTGGTVATGGILGMGGTLATGGIIGTGGTLATGGIIATGGSFATGGVTSSGGTMGPVITNCPGAAPAGITTAWCSCEQYGSSNNGAYVYDNCIWGSGPGNQCIWTSAAAKWGVAANHPTTAGVKSYPNVTLTPQKAISAFASYTSSFNVTVPSSGSWDTSYKLLVRPTSAAHIKVSLWMNRNGNIQPSSNATAPSYPVADRPNVSLGGHVWDVYFAKDGNDGEIVSFVRTQNTNAGTVDILAALLWIIANNDPSYTPMTTRWTLDEVKFGFEIVSDGSPQAFVANSFSVTSN